MKTMMLFVICVISLCYFGLNGSSGSSALTSPKGFSTDSIQFTLDVQPILQQKCSPCHFPGGKMYAKMPFDAPQTILDHEKGVLKRFKDEQLSMLSQFFEQAKKMGPPLNTE